MFQGRTVGNSRTWPGSNPRDQAKIQSEGKPLLLGATHNSHARHMPKGPANFLETEREAPSVSAQGKREILTPVSDNPVSGHIRNTIVLKRL